MHAPCEIVSCGRSISSVLVPPPSQLTWDLCRITIIVGVHRVWLIPAWTGVSLLPVVAVVLSFRAADEAEGAVALPA